MNNETQLAYELGFYKSQAKILQDALHSALGFSTTDLPVYEKMANMDLEDECDEVVKRAAWLDDTKERKL